MRRFFLGLTLISFAAGCGGGEDETPEPDAGEDECVGLADGTPCGVSRICFAAACAPSVCGDGFVDATQGEECDDENLTEGDGCDNDCTLSCHDDADCSDANACNGFERCVAVGGVNRCQDGTPPDCGPPPGGGSPCTDYVCDAAAEDLESACLVIDEVVCYADADDDGFPDQKTTQGTDAQCECEAGFMKRRDDSLWDCNDHTPAVRPTPVGGSPVAFRDRPYCEDGSPAEAKGDGPDCHRDAPKEAVCFEYACGDESEPSFDFDCNGRLTEERRIVSKQECELFRDECVGDGWMGEWVPSCGDISVAQQCDLSQKCDPRYAERVERPQRCR